MTTTPNPGREAGPATIVTVFNEEGDEFLDEVLAEAGYEVRPIHYAAEIWDLDTRPAGHIHSDREEPYLLELHGTTIWLGDLQAEAHARVNRRPDPPRFPEHLDAVAAEFRTGLLAAIAEASPKG